jgi:uncharacterized protein
MSSENLHEDPKILGSEIIDQHRATISLIEELEAVDWYNQRAKATVDDELRAILEHNRDEEKEHAAMVLEWLRRHDPALGANLKVYLFKEGPIKDVTDAPGAGSAPGSSDSHGLGIGDLRKTSPEGAGRP